MTEIDGSVELRVVFINEEEGKLIKSSTLFLNLYDFWTYFHASYKTLFIWYHPKMHLLEMALRKKWEATKDLPLVNIILKKFKEKDEYFNLKKYLGEDEQKYFELLQYWKINFEKEYLEKNPYLRFAPIRHKKILMKRRRSCLSLLFYFF